ncbi:MAG: hypothetical protein JW863_04850 [Chitinispirillaceae bacterium]|nr:hypothetical protein [Chitinispirillaceae bacterium]
MKCEQVRTYFDRMYREGDRFDRKQVISHMSECGGCRREFDRWCILAREMSAVPEMDAPPDFNQKMLRKIDILKQKKPEKRNHWSWTPSWQTYPVPIALCAVLLMIITGIVVTLYRKPATDVAVKHMEASHDVRVTAHFRLSCTEARQVAVVGDFNGWDTGKDQLVKNGDGTWGIDMQIEKGCYQYLFLVDGTEWHRNPAAGRQVPDGFGGFNMVIEL